MTGGQLSAAARAVFQAGAWSRDQLQDYQSSRLRALARHAWKRVPFYRRQMESAGLHWSDVGGLESLARFPVMDRTAIRETPLGDLLAQGLDATALSVHHTSGTSGQPLAVRRTAFEERLLHMFRLRVMFGYGMRWRDRRVSVRSSNASERAWWVKLGLIEQHTIATREGPDALRAWLLQLRPEVVEGYATTLADIGDRLSSADRKTLHPRFVAAGAEPVTPDRRRRIAEGFQARVYDVYGSEEFNLIAAECPQTGLLHLCETSLIAEVLCDGRPARPGETGQLVATALHSYAMPFLRWRLGDRVRRGPEPCPCGAPFATLEEVQGREEDVFWLPGGRILCPYWLVVPLMERFPWVRQYQLVQERPDLVRLMVVAAPEVTDAPERLSGWRRDAEEDCGAPVRVVVEQVAQIPLEPSGKFRSIRSLLHRPVAGPTP